MYIPVLIVGSGIAGLSVAYNLNKKNIKNLVITKEANYLKSNSIIAPANMRLFKDFIKGIEFYMNQCNGNYETVSSIYSNQDFLIETLNELNIEVKKTPMGIIPQNSRELGGQILLKKLFCYVKNILTNTLLIDIKKHEKYIECLAYNDKEKWMHINCGAIVFATGGFASIFDYNDNANSATGECTYIIQKETNKLKGMSTIMFHPFGIENGKRILTGDIVSCIENIYYKNTNGNMELLDLELEVLDAIKSNKYHSSEMFNKILHSFYNKDIYIKLKNEFDIDILKEHRLPKKILVNNMIHIHPTAHYTSGGIVVDKSFKADERIFANGEIIYDGNKGIGRIPGHPFTSSIIGGRIIANEIQKMKFEEIYDITKFDIEKKIVQNNEYNYLKTKKIFEESLKKVQSILLKNGDKEKLENQIKNQLDYIYRDIKCLKELMIYYRMNLLYEIIKDIEIKDI